MCGARRGNCSTGFARKERWTEDLSLVFDDPVKLQMRVSFGRYEEGIIRASTLIKHDSCCGRGSLPGCE